MRVEQNANIVDIVKQSVGPETKEKANFIDYVSGNSNDEYSADKTNFQVKNATYGKPEAEEKKTAADSLINDASLDAAERKNQMVVLSNTTSEEDYEKMQEEGFSLDATASATIMTVIDEIKAQLLKAGADISSFGDDLSKEQLEAFAGSPELAMQLMQAMQQADIPCTEGNLRDAMDAVQQAKALEIPNDSTVKYLLDNEMEPTIENLYKAEYSGNYQMDSKSSIDMTPFISRVEKIIKQAGLEVNERTLGECQWMLEHDILLNEENLSYVDALKNMELPMDEQALLECMTEAVSEGKRPQDGLMLKEFTMNAQAQDALSVVQKAADEDIAYVIDNRMDLTVRNLAYAIAVREAGENSRTQENVRADVPVSAGDFTADTQSAASGDAARRELALITARRQLEELRLAMTSEANYALLRKGIQIDTEPLVQLVEELKATENTYYEQLLNSQGVEATVENVSLFRETTEKVDDLKSAPAYVLGMRRIHTATVDEVHREAEAMRDRFIRANERYETLMTAPRTDLGDSIQKAFRNVDDILEDIGVEINEANRRAVRILAYNETAITPESVARMKAVDEEVQRTFCNMTPATVLELIRKGKNPLDMDFETLNKEAEQIAAETEEKEMEKFSEFLWKLEQNHAITEEERASYIGVYRLIHQVQQSDGAVSGALVNQGAKLTMRNLMMAVRSGHRMGKMDYTVDEMSGALEHGEYLENSITSQIERAYQDNCIKDVADVLTPDKMRQVLKQDTDWMNMTPEQLKEALQQAAADETAVDHAYAKEQLAQLSKSASAADDVYAVLKQYDIPNTALNVMAMEALMRNRNGFFRQVFGEGRKSSDKEVGADDIETMKQEVLEAFGEAVSSPEEMAEAQERLGILAENVMRGMMENDEVTSLDVREMRLMSAQLSISRTLAREEQYSVPVMVSDGVVNVSLKIVRGVDKKGVVDITMESALRGKIAATFQAKEKGVTALVVSDNAQTKALLEENAAALMEGLTDEEDAEIRYAYISDLEHTSFANGNASGGKETPDAEGSENYQIQTTRLYRIAESFIRQMREVL